MVYNGSNIIRGFYSRKDDDTQEKEEYGEFEQKTNG